MKKQKKIKNIARNISTLFSSLYPKILKNKISIVYLQHQFQFLEFGSAKLLSK